MKLYLLGISSEKVYVLKKNTNENYLQNIHIHRKDIYKKKI